MRVGRGVLEFGFVGYRERRRAYGADVVGSVEVAGQESKGTRNDLGVTPGVTCSVSSLV